MSRKVVPELDEWEPWVPRPRQVILAELREAAERYLNPEDLKWFKQNFPKVWLEGQLEMW